jgi:hypothetical protein
VALYHDILISQIFVNKSLRIEEWKGMGSSRTIHIKDSACYCVVSSLLRQRAALSEYRLAHIRRRLNRVPLSSYATLSPPLNSYAAQYYLLPTLSFPRLSLARKQVRADSLVILGYKHLVNSDLSEALQISLVGNSIFTMS